MSDSDKKPKIPPPDDFSKTTPNINVSDDDDDTSGWDKTNYSIPSQTPADDWGKTVINYDVSSLDEEDDSDSNDFNSTHYSNKSPKQPDWGMTQANIGIDSDFEASDRRDSGEEDVAYGATTPYFRLPEAEREKYQDLPPTPTEKAQQEEKEKREKGGVPGWFWVSAGLMLLFGLTLIVLLGAWYVLSPKKGFDVIVTGAPQGSRFLVDGSEWGVPSTNDEHILYGLEAGTRRIQIIHKGHECRPEDVTGIDGGNPKSFTPTCNPTNKINLSDADCEKTLNEDTREACAEEILDGLSNPPDLARLLKALSLLRINFAKDSAAVPERNKRILRKASLHIKNLPPQVVIEIGGHTDSDGSDEYNQKLSERRAKSVKEFFLSLGVKESRLTSRGYGEADKIADNDTEEGKARNRRIDYKAIKQ